MGHCSWVKGEGRALVSKMTRSLDANSLATVVQKAAKSDVDVMMLP